MKAISALLLVFAISSCTHEPPSRKFTGDYLIIASAGGMRPPPATYYYLSENVLKADTAVYVLPADLSLFHFNYKLPSSKHELVKGALSSIPSELLGLNHKEIGISMVAVDGGFTVVHTKINGILYDWKFHDNLGNADEDIIQFVGKVRLVFKK